MRRFLIRYWRVSALVLTLAEVSLPGADPYLFTVLAGPSGGVGFSDGTGGGARFQRPAGIATDRAGTIYVADTSNHTIRRITPAGVVTTVAGMPGDAGCADGTGSAARFYFPGGLALDDGGTIYVADTGNHTIRKITPGGVVSTLAGLAGSRGHADDLGSAARFDEPTGVAVDAAGTVYVVDNGSYTIRTIAPGGRVSTLAGLADYFGSEDGTGSDAHFYRPLGVAVDGERNVYVTDGGNHTIRKITAHGDVTTLAGLADHGGSADGTNSAARFYYPSGIAVDNAGTLYVVDDNSIVRKITPAGSVSTIAGLAGEDGDSDGTNSAARFYHPQGVAVDSAGNLYVADTSNSTIRKVAPGGMVTTLAGTPRLRGSADGLAGAARFEYPEGVAVDRSGNVFVADTGNTTIRKITPDGTVTTFAGLAGDAGSADGTNSGARFGYPHSLAVDGSGNVFVADTFNHTIRRITTNGVVTTFAGKSEDLDGDSFPDGGFRNATGTTARFNFPFGVAVDSSGNVYVADTDNYAIRKITPAGVVSTLAGSPSNPPGSANGTGGAARFHEPYGVAADGAGNVYVADRYNCNIRKITPGGVVTTLAGSADDPAGSVDEQGTAARFNFPHGLAADTNGNIYVADTYNSKIRKITPAGVVSTLAGSPSSQAGSEDGVGAAARFDYPEGVAVDGAGNVYVADTFNQKIRFGTPVPITITRSPADQTVFEGGTAAFSIEAVGGASPLNYRWRFNGSDVANATNATLALTGVTTNQAGDYVVVIGSPAGSVTSSVAALTVLVGQPDLGIVGQPLGQTVNPGTSVTLSVSAVGNPPPAYQWRRNGVNIPGAVNATLTLNAVEPTDGGQYSVVVASLAGVVISQVADVVVDTPALLLADNFAGRVGTNSFSGVGSGSNADATREPGETNHVGRAGGKSLWFKWTAPSNGIATFHTRGSGFDTLLAVYAGESLGGLVEMSGDDDRGAFLNSQVSFNAVAGTAYSIAIDGFGGASGHIVLSWSLDASASGLPRFILQPASQTVSNGATVSFAAQVASQTPVEYQWYFNCEWIQIEDNPTATNATLVVGNVQAAQVGSYSVRVNNGLNREVESLPAFLETGPSKDVLSQDKLRNLAAAISSPQGIQPAGLERNRVVLHASPARGYSGTQIFSTFGAVSEAGEPIHCGVIGGASQWFAYLAETNGTLNLNTVGSDFDTVLAVYTGPGTDYATLVPVACDNNSGMDGRDSSVDFPVVTGTTYWIAVDGVNAAQGTVRLNWALAAPPLRLDTGAGGALAFTNGSFRLLFDGVAGQSVVIEASTDLSQWVPVFTNAGLAGPVEFLDTGAPNHRHRFYRAIHSP